MTSLHRVFVIVVCAALPSGAAAQLALGRVVSTGPHKPLTGIVVTLIDGKGHAVDSSRTDSSGTFYVPARGRGTYHLEFGQRGLWFDQSPAFEIVGSESHEGAYAIGDHRGDAALADDEVDARARPLPGNEFARYPVDLRNRGIQGGVLAKLVIDTRGRVVPGSVEVLSSTSPEFSAAVLKVVYDWRFQPASLRGSPAPSIACLSSKFRLTNFGGTPDPDARLESLMASWPPEGRCPKAG